MTLFSADLFRNFALGFVAGALIVGAATADQWVGDIESPARAAVPLEAPQADSDFLIEPIEISG
ncbi:MAG: hypothetical protein ACX930_13800 [Erythrobacter sp.]